jgi:nitrite reductase/ring-hydroxylating ferredoxin subunit
MTDRGGESGEAQKVFFCSLAELKTRGVVTRLMEDIRDEVTAVYQDGQIRVFSSVCPHWGGEFRVTNGEFRCLWHGRRYAVSDGRCLTHADETSLRPYAFVTAGDRLEILVP